MMQPTHRAVYEIEFTNGKEVIRTKVIVNADLLTIALRLAKKAYRSKRKRATLGGGCIVVSA